MKKKSQRVSLFDRNKILTKQVQLTGLDLTTHKEHDMIIISWTEDGVPNGRTMHKELFLEMYWQFNHKYGNY